MVDVFYTIQANKKQKGNISDARKHERIDANTNDEARKISASKETRGTACLQNENADNIVNIVISAFATNTMFATF